MFFLLRILLGLFGLTALLIGLSFYLLGINPTAQFFVGLTSYLTGDQTPINDLAGANVDSEFRFYSIFWIVFTGFVIHTAVNLQTMMHRVPLLLGIFFLGGVGRLISLQTVGEPHLLFMILLVLELVLPVFLLVLWSQARKGR